MAERASLCGGFPARFSPRVQEKLLALAETVQFKAGQDTIGEGDPRLYLHIVKSAGWMRPWYLPRRLQVGR